MNITHESGLAIASLLIKFKRQSMLLKNALLDTGCAVSIFDTDVVEPIGLIPKRNDARLVCMTGIGGRGDYCVEQVASKLTIDDYVLYQFHHQLGNIKERYGFDAILGNDFLTATGLIKWESLSLPRSPQNYKVSWVH